MQVLPGATRLGPTGVSSGSHPNGNPGLPLSHNAHIDERAGGCWRQLHWCRTVTGTDSMFKPAAHPRPPLRLKGLVGLLAVCLMQSALADELKPFEVTYTAIWHGLTVAQSTLTLARREGDTWTYSSRTETRGFARLFSTPPVQESVMRVTEAGVQPLTYRVGNGNHPSPKDIQLHFDWAAGHVTGTYEDSPLDVPVPPGTQDELSLGIALVQELMRGRTPEKFILLDGKAPHSFRYVREKEEVLSTKIGKMPTIVYRSTKVDGQRTTRFWLAPGFGFVPMRVEQKSDDGTEYSLVVQSARR